MMHGEDEASSELESEDWDQTASLVEIAMVKAEMPSMDLNTLCIVEARTYD